MLKRFAYRSATVIVAAVLSTAAPHTVLGQDLMTTVSDAHMESLLNNQGIEFTKGKSEHTWKLKFDDYSILLMLGSDNSDGLLHIAFGDVTVTPGRMNEWNSKKRFSRAYADSDKNPALENDLDFAGGVSDSTIKAWIRLFRSSVSSFVRFLKEG